MNSKVLITGGTGLIGSRLTELLIESGYEVSYLSRSKGNGRIKKYVWDIYKKYIDQDAIKNADYIISLAGANVFEKKWSKEFKKEILDSRVQSTNLLYDQLRSTPNNVKAFISASAIGYYGFDTGSEWINEQDKPGDDFLSEVVKQWEASTSKIQELNIRTVMFRIGIVLSSNGGALEKLLTPIRFNTGAALGSGKQYVSWIHVDDLCFMMIKALEDETLSGVYNAVAPEPVTNEVLTKEIAHAIDKNIFLPNVPSIALKFLLGSERASILLGGNRVSSEKIEKAGYKFHFRELNTALQNLLK